MGESSNLCSVFGGMAKMQAVNGLSGEIFARNCPLIAWIGGAAIRGQEPSRIYILSLEALAI